MPCDKSPLVDNRIAKRVPDQTPQLMLDALPRGPTGEEDDARQPVFFLHIPKTAGTSFLLTLENVFGGNRLVRLDPNQPGFHERFAAILDGRHEPISCLAGHIPLHALGVHAERFRIFTILRNPIARVFSLYRFMRKAVPAVKAGLGLSENYTFRDFITSEAPGLYSQTNNAMCRMLANEPAFTDPGDSRFIHAEDHPALIERALALLERIDFGLAEDMPGTHRIIQHQWPIPFPLDETTLNTTERDGIDLDWRNVLEVVEHNRLDIVLYERASEIFRSRLAALDSTEAARDVRGVVFRPVLGKRTGLPDIAGRQGFHGWEKSGIAWLAAGGPARVHFLPPAPASRITLRVFGIGTDYPFERIKLHLHGYPLPFTIIERDAQWCTIETRLARAAEGINTLAITPPSFIAVRSLDPTSVDTRSLGIAVQSMTFST